MTGSSDNSGQVPKTPLDISKTDFLSRSHKSFPNRRDLDAAPKLPAHSNGVVDIKEDSTNQGEAGEKFSKSKRPKKQVRAGFKKHSDEILEVKTETDEPVDGLTLLQDLVASFTRFLSLPKGAAEATAVWVVFTHAVEAAEHAPVLVFTSPVPNCGKTTALKLLKCTVANPKLADNMTPAVVYRMIAIGKPTILFDEGDTFLTAHEELGGILNSGHSPDGSVWRCVGDKHEPTEFPTFCPKAVAIIGKLPWLSLETRSIIIRMQRGRADENIERLSKSREQEIAELSARVDIWARQNVEKLKGADPKMPKEFSGRLADNWRPLFAIADVIAGDWPTRIRNAAIDLTGVSELTRSEQLLVAIKKAFAKAETDKISSHDLCRAIKSDDLNYTQPRLAKALKPFGVSPKNNRSGTITKRGYKVDQFEDAFARYLPPALDEPNIPS